MIDEIAFVHPKDMQDGKVPISARDITTNLPYVPGCHLAFDHHSSEILRNGEVVHTWKPKAATTEAKFTWTDPAPVREAKEASYYYVRVTQTDEQMAWSSPMWVTYKP